MKKLLYLFLFLSIKAHAGLTLNAGNYCQEIRPIFISSTSHYAGSASSVSLTLTKVTAGQKIVVKSIINTNSTTLVRVTDNATVTSSYTIVGSVTNSAAPTKVTVLVATANASGTLTITVTNGVTADSGAYAAAFDNVGSTDTFVTGSSAGSVTTLTTGNFTMGQADEAFDVGLGDEATAITNMVIISTAAAMVKTSDELSNTSSGSYGIGFNKLATQSFTANWTTASTGGALVGIGIRGSCGL